MQLKLYYDGGMIAAVYITPWPSNCGYIVMSNFSWPWGTPEKLKKNVNLITDMINVQYPKHQVCAFSYISTHPYGKDKIAALSFVKKVHTGETKYGRGTPITMHLWNPSKGKVHTLRDLAKKYKLDADKLSWGR